MALLPTQLPLSYVLVCALSLQELGLQAEDSFVLKVVQLEELRHVRHSIFVIGGAGTGKSKVVSKQSHYCIFFTRQHN